MAFLDPRTWIAQPAASGARAADPAPRAVCVAIDILDEQHSLGLALCRLATDAALRRDLAIAARAHWETLHTLERMTEDYERVIGQALARPGVPPLGLPPHLLADGTESARRLVDDMGVAVDFLPPAPARGPLGPAVE